MKVKNICAQDTNIYFLHVWQDYHEHVCLFLCISEKEKTEKKSDTASPVQLPTFIVKLSMIVLNFDYWLYVSSNILW